MTQGKAQAFDPTDEKAFTGTVASDWIRDLESSDSRTHKEQVIEKALMAANLGSASAQCFLYNCYLALNPYWVYGVKKVPKVRITQTEKILGLRSGACAKASAPVQSQVVMPAVPSTP